MILKGYRFKQEIYKTDRSRYWSAVREVDGKPVIIKTVLGLGSASIAQAWLQREFDLIRNLAVKGIPRPIGLQTFSGGSALIYEQIDGRPLREHTQGKRLGNMGFFLDMAISLVELLDELHGRHLIHKDIQPDHLFVQPETRQVWLTDFRFATLLPKETPALSAAGMVEGTLAYVSPEQTGRTNRNLDYRTDFYSLGVTFYQLLTGRLPFESRDALELLHAHLAIQPRSPMEAEPGIPEVVSELVLKLLSKNAEERYQSAKGLLEDLRLCRKKLTKTGSIPAFRLGERDVPMEFQISQKLYGREQEVAQLLALFEESGQGRVRMAAVEGPPGVGKTSLVLEIYKNITRKKGYFITGKCDSFHQDIPYRVLVHAFQDLIRQVLTESSLRLENWKERLRNAMGENGRVIVEVIPQLELIIGPQPVVTPLDPVKSQNRFNRVFIDFIQAFCRIENPLVIFLDDLQWVDGASLYLIENLLTDASMHHLFLIISFRDSELHPAHPLAQTLQKLKHQGYDYSRIPISPLNLEDIGRLLQDSLHADGKDLQLLARLVWQKTGGNPFFVNQFLILLHQERGILFNTKHREWEWNLRKIRGLDITENVLELLMRRLERLPESTRGILTMAACIGSFFDIKTLQTITNQKAPSLLQALTPAVHEDLLVTMAGSVPGEAESEPVVAAVETFKFRHDRVRQAAYSLITDTEKKAVHLKIGRLMLGRMQSDQVENQLFSILHHFNFAHELIRTQPERKKIAELNLAAGIKAKHSAAFETAHAYFTAGILLLGAGGWRRYYDLMLKLHLEAMESARLCGKNAIMEICFSAVKQNTRTVLDQVDAYQNKIQALMAENQPLQALKNANDILKQIGVILHPLSSEVDVGGLIDETLLETEGRAPEDLAELQAMKDPFHLAAMKILGSILASAYLGAPALFPIIACQQVKLSIQHGNAPDSAIAYSAFGIVLCEFKNNIETGYRFGRLGLMLLKRFAMKEREARVHFLLGSMVFHWKIHFRETLELLLAGYFSGVETGDFEFAGYNALGFTAVSFCSDRSLMEIEQDMRRYGEAVKRLKQMPSSGYIAIFHQMVLNLLWKSRPAEVLQGEIYDERTMLPVHREKCDLLAVFIHSFCKMILGYFFEDYSGAWECAEEAEAYISMPLGTPLIPLYHFYAALIRLARHVSMGKALQEQNLKKVEFSLSRLKIWGRHAPMNYENKYQLVAAESAGLQGMEAEAIRSYDAAIQFSHENGFGSDEALANELAAKFWLRQGKNEFARLCMQRAYTCYSTWGVVTKAEALVKKHPQLFSTPWQAALMSTPAGDFRKDHWSQAGLDLASFMKASQAISGEIEFQGLLRTLMKIVMENAGADRGFLLMEATGGFGIAAQGTLEGQKIAVELGEMSMEGSAHISMPVVHYVVRTREQVVLNPQEQERFQEGGHLRGHRPKSLLCAPILHKSKLTGILYLENQLVADAFSAGRMELLKLLCSQIAISIENTRLFEERKKAEEKYRSIFENALEGIFIATPEGKFLSANPATAQILGYATPEELLEKVTDIVSQLEIADQARVDFFNLIGKQRSVADFEVRCRRKHGDYIWVSLNARPIFNTGDQIDLFEGFIVDITARKAATDALRRQEEQLRKENIRLRTEIKDRFRFGRIIGKSTAMQEVYGLIAQAAATDVPVIIYGESGTGKELVAKAIHELSERKEGDFVPVNCGAIPGTLLESEFFGYKKGAFTGAHADKKGLLDQSRNGTLFLDEVGEIDLSFQVKLLRALEDGSYTPLGEQIVRKTNARIITATNRDLQQVLRTGRMREDFFYRIHVIPIHLPPLRERKEDIPLLVEHFLETNSRGRKTPPLTGEAIEGLLSHDWPGNVRELQNVLQRYLTIGKMDFLAKSIPKSTSEVVHAEDVEKTGHGQIPYQEVMENMEKKLILKALERHHGNRRRAAAHLAIPLRSFYRKMKQYQIV